jgi:hypothetical protein
MREWIKMADNADKKSHVVVDVEDGPGSSSTSKSKDAAQQATSFLDANSSDTRAPQSEADASQPHNGAGVEYRVYKRRWFGLFQLVLLNIIVSWDVSVEF